MTTLKVLLVVEGRAEPLAFERFVEEHSLPITFVLAGSLNEAKCLVGQREFDVIVAEHSLENGTALDLLPFAPGVPVILIVGAGEEEIAAQACTTGSCDYLVKDIGGDYLEQLPQRIEKAVGQRMRSADTLRKNQELYRRAVNTANEGIWIADQDYNTSFVNSRMADMLGYQPEEMVGQPIHHFLFPDDLADHRQRVSNRGQGVGEQYERRLRRQDGSILWTILSTTSTVSEQGEFLGSFAMVTDITEHKRAEEKLQKSEEKYRMLVENANEAIIITQDGALKFANPKASELFGYPLEEAVGRPFTEFIHPDDQLLVAERYRKRLGGEVSKVVYPFRTIHKDGSIRWAEINSVLIAWEDRPAIMSYLRDVTERKRAEEALRESEVRYWELFENINSGVAVYTVIGNGQDFIFKDFNRAGERIDHDQRERLIGKSIFEVRPGVEQFGLIEVFRQVWQTGQPAYHPVTSYHDNKLSGWYENFVYKLPSGEIVAVFENITERKRVEEALSESEEWHRALVETSGHAGIGIVVLQNIQNRQAAIVFANEQAGAISGYSQEELLKMSLEDLMPPDITKQIMLRYKDRQEGKPVPNYYEAAIVNRDQVRIPLITSAATLRFHGKTATVVYFRDTTELKRGEEALAKVSREWQATFDAANDMIWLLDKEQQVLRSNKASERFFQRPCGELVGMQCWEIMHCRSEPISDCPILRVRKSLRRETMELQLGDSWFVVTVDPILDSTGQYSGAVHIVSDITERKRIEEALRESEERFRTLYENSTIGLYRTTPDGRIHLANPTLVRMLGYSSFDDLSTRNLEKNGFAPSYPRTQFVEMIEKDGEVKGLESAWKRKDGTIIFVRESARAIRDSQARTLYYDGTIEDITERKRADEVLRESEEKYRLVIEKMQDGVYKSTHEGKFLEVNPAMVKILGYDSKEELLAIDIKSQLYFAPGDRESGVLDEKLEEMSVFRLRKKDGSELWVEAHGRHVVNDEGTVLYHEGVLRDITERKRAEEALQNERSLLRTLIDNIPDSIYSKDLACRKTLANLTELHYLGAKSESEVVGKDDFEFYPKELAEGYFADDQSVMQSGQPVLNKEELVINENGHQRWLLTSKLPLKDESGNITGIVGIGRDITDRKRAEEALRESEEKFRAIFQNMAAACCLDEIIDTAGKATDYRILDVNPSYERITGIRRSQVIGALASQVYGTGKAPFLDIYSKVAESGEPIAFETYFEPIGKYLEITVSRPRKGRFSTVFSDITERKQLEERIRQVRSDLLFAVSHDLKSPLQALRQTQEMLSELTPGKGLARFQEYSEIWKRNLQRLERMINNLVDSQHGEGDRFPLLLAPCDLKEMVKQVVEDSRGYALAKQVEVQLESQPVPESSCDEEAMARVVENLLTNAVKFSKKGGKVDIRLGMEGDMLRLEVEDHGAGIPANEQVQLFQPFQRGRSAQHKGIPGTGLGLYVSRRIVEEHGGTITLTSEEGKGTTVTVTLPLKE